MTGPGPFPPLAGEGVVAKQRRMRGVARSATASRSSAQFVIASRIRTTANSVDAITSSFGNPKALISQTDVTNFVGQPYSAMLCNILRLTIRSRRAPRDPPHPSLLRNDTFPRKGGRTAPFLWRPLVSQGGRA